MTRARHKKPAPAPLVPRAKVWLEIQGSYAFGLGISEILQAVDQAGSIKQAAQLLGKSYRHVWSRVKEAEEALGRSLVEAHVGGSGTQRSFLTEEARCLVRAFLELRGEVLQFVEEKFRRLLRSDAFSPGQPNQQG